MKKTAIALALGFALLFSLVIEVHALNTVSSTEGTRQFDFGVTRVYIQGESGNLYYNITYVSELPYSNKAIVEVYLIELYLNGSLLASQRWGFSPEGSQEISDTFLFVTYYMPSSLLFVNPNRTEMRTQGFVLFRELNPLEDYSANISLSVKRLGVLIVEGESVNNFESGEVILQVALQREGNGFLYKELPVSSPTPSPEPTPIVEPLPTTLVIGFAIAVAAVVGLGLLVYIKKRHGEKNP